MNNEPSSKEYFSSSPRRNKYEIWVEILHLCSSPKIKLSGIMRELRLRTGKCKEYLLFLLQKELLQISRDEEDGNITYSTTSKGKKAVVDFFSLLEQYFS